jgi:hypothetical protein
MLGPELGKWGKKMSRMSWARVRVLGIGILRFCEYWHVYVLGLGYFVWPWSPHGHRTPPHRHCTFRDVTPGPLTITDTCIMYYLTNFEASRNVILHMRYVSTCVGVRVVGGVGKQWTKAIRCGACYYSIVVNAHRVKVWPIPTLMPLESKRRQNTINNTDET